MDLREFLAGAKWAVASPLDPTGGPFKNNGKSLCFCGGAFGIPLTATVLKMSI